MRRIALVLALIGPAALAAQSPGPARVIDAHVHVELDGPAPARLAEDWRAAGVVGAVVHLPEGVTEPGRRVGTVPAGVRYCAGVGAEPDTIALARALEARSVTCVKIYLGYVPRWASDPAYAAVYRLAARHGAPVVFHTGDTSSPDARLKYADPLTIDDVAVDHRDVTFVIAHCGNPWLASAAEVAYKNPNVVLECSALMTGDVGAIDPAARERYVVDAIRWVFGYVEDPAKLMFGTDWPLVELAPYVRAYQDAIPAEHWDAVFYGNAARVFGF